MDLQEKGTEFLYRTVLGRLILKGLVCPKISRLAGRFLDSPLSVKLIPPFIRQNEIDMSEYEPCIYKSYNEFFTRKIRKEQRPIEKAKNCLISPCDGSALVLPLGENSVFQIKKSRYNIRRLLHSKKLAEHYKGGSAVILRLSVTDYHRYCYVDDGIITDYRTIPGILHTVQPIANEYYPVYHENTREYCILHSENFGDIVVMEVGALFVGRIVNDKDRGIVRRGEEKGRFEFGGSTIVLLLEQSAVQWQPQLLENSATGKETPVKMGEVIAVR